MVKGVNKSIIEVNNTGSEVFERIVFYVSPKFSSLSSKSLMMATGELEKTLENSVCFGESLRKRVKYKNKRKNALLIFSALILFLFAGFLIFKFLL